MICRRSSLKGFILVLTVGGLAACAQTPSTTTKFPPQLALQKFYAFEGKEEELMDPLILGGPEVVPTIIREVENKEMPKRRYANGFLGNEKAVEALPLLNAVLLDETEKEYYRGDALLAIFQIDNGTGHKLASQYVSESGYLGTIAGDILSNDPSIHRQRSYEMALRNLPFMLND